VSSLALRSTTGRAAMAYATRFGWCVFPLWPKSKEPHGRLVRHGHKDATRDPEQIHRWWSVAPDAGVALSCAMSGLVVLDVDAYKADCDFHELETKLGRLPETVRQLTPQGGVHYLFRNTGGSYVGKPCNGAEVKHHGYIVGAPSVHPNGGTYRWDVGAHPIETPIADLPAAWRAHLIKDAPLRGPLAGEPSKSDAANSWLGHAFRHMGWLGAPLPGGRRAARCPWLAEHTDGRGDGHDSSTVLFPAEAGHTFGGFRCAHGHCAERTARDVLALLPGHVRWVAEQALRREQTRLTLSRLEQSRKAGAR
jgi:hypothetical protein